MEYLLSDCVGVPRIAFFIACLFGGIWVGYTITSLLTYLLISKKERQRSKW